MTDAIVVLEAAGVMVVLDLTADRPPAIVHWGHPVPGLEAGPARTLISAATAVGSPNYLDAAPRVSLLPAHADGWPGRPGLRGSRAGRAWSPRFATTAATLDGEPVGGFVNAGAGSLVVDATDEECGLAVRLTVELLPSGLLRANAELTNTGADGYQLDALELAFPVSAQATELLDFAGRWGCERVPQRVPFGSGTHLRENRRGRTGADSAYLLHAGVPGFGFASGDVHAVHLAFSGNHVHYADRAFTGPPLLGGGELLLPGEIRLNHAERYVTPWLYGAFGAGLDAIARRFHTHLRARVPAVTPLRPVTLNVWEAVYFDHDRDQLLRLAERAAQVGIERYVLDDGWFGARRDARAGLGDWVVSPDAWPQGLHPLIDRVHELGMQFGLWFEPEMVNADSDVARAHPEWVMAARHEWPPESRYQQVLNLAIPGAYQHVRDQLTTILDSYRIDYIKWDHNRDLIEAGNQLDGGRASVHDQTLGCYRLLDELRAAHPDLEIESCSSGGGRVDLAVLERTDRIWTSDCSDPLERQHIMRWTAQLVAPEYIGAHIASGRSHTTGRTHDLAFRAGTAVFGHLGVEWDLGAASPGELAELAAWVRFYRRHRHLLMAGDIVRTDTRTDSVFVHGVLAPDRSQAIFAMAVLAAPATAPGPPIRLRGLDPATYYRVRPVVVDGGAPLSGLVAPQWWGDADDDGQYAGCLMSGAAIEHVGLAAPQLDPEQVVLFRAEAVPAPMQH